MCLVKWLSSINTLFIFIFIIFELLCVVLILLISPLDTENNPLTGQEKKNVQNVNFHYYYSYIHNIIIVFF
ncbi:MAG: accessory gene regulator B family protein [Ruminococcus sp.]